MSNDPVVIVAARRSPIGIDVIYCGSVVTKNFNVLPSNLLRKRF